MTFSPLLLYFTLKRERAGMRQAVYHAHAHRPGYKIVTRSSQYIEDMSTSLFCLAPTGGGHGKRQVRVREGCVVLIVVMVVVACVGGVIGTAC